MRLNLYVVGESFACLVEPLRQALLRLPFGRDEFGGMKSGLATAKRRKAATCEFFQVN